MTFPSSPPPLAGVVHTDVRVHGARWHVAVAGEGPPVVLLHGWPQHWWMWRRIIPELARSHRVYAPDLRGFGWSDAPAGDYSIPALARDVERLLDELGIDTCALVGHDWGGLTSFMTAIHAPERVERLVALSIIHPWLSLGETHVRALPATVYQVPLATPFVGEYLQRFGAKALGAVLRAGAAPEHRWDAQDVRLFTEQWQRPAHARAASALYRSFLTRGLPALLAGRYDDVRLGMPIVHATGRKDPVVTPTRIAGGAAHASRLRTEVIEGAGHFVVDERPAEVLRLVREHLGS